MAHWFHRNPLKATTPVGFELKGILSTSDASKIATDARFTRVKLLELLRDANNELEEVETQFNTYMKCLHGFLFAFDEKGGDSKLRYLVTVKWTHSMLGLQPTELADTWYEALHMTINMALWYSKHAAKLAGTDEIKEVAAKESHKCLRKAAGLFDWALKERGRIDHPSEQGGDMDQAVLECYVLQCTAEAQEVTVARAIELKHSSELTSALGNETAKLFLKADTCLAQQDTATFEKWRKYLMLKHQFYLALAYAYLGESLLKEDKCGEAVRACREGLKYYQQSEENCKDYAKAKGPGFTAKPEKHLFFRRLKPILERHKEKAERENSLIYHVAIPEEVPELSVNSATYGLVKPEPFDLPLDRDQWTARVYGMFDIAKAAMPDFKKPKKDSKELPSPKEEPVYQSDKDSNSTSGCTIS